MAMARLDVQELLPTDVWAQIGRCCSAQDLSNLAATSRFFRNDVCHQQWEMRNALLVSKDAQTSYRRNTDTSKKNAKNSKMTTWVIRCHLASSFAKRMEYHAYYHHDDVQCHRICSNFPDLEPQCIREQASNNSFEFFVRLARRDNEQLIAQGLCDAIPSMDRDVLYLDVYSLLRYNSQLNSSLESLIRHCHKHHRSIVASILADEPDEEGDLIEEDEEEFHDEPTRVTTATSSDTIRHLNNALGNLAVTVVALNTKSSVRTTPQLIVSTAGFVGLDVQNINHDQEESSIQFKMDSRCTTPHNTNGQIYMGMQLNASLPTYGSETTTHRHQDLQYLRLETFDVHRTSNSLWQDEQDDMYDEMYQWESNPWEPTNMRQRQRDRRPPVNRVRNSISSGGGSTFRSGARRRRRAPRGARALDGGS